MRRQLTRGRVLAAAFMTAMAVSAPVALGASAPAATTAAASQVTSRGAVLAATVNPSGESTTYAFQYGTSTNYGSQTATASAGSGSTAVSVHATLSALVSGTTYHYRLVATNPSGTTTGNDMTFTTAKNPPTVTVGSPSLVTTASATLVGTVDPNGKATTYSFQYGPSASYGLQSPATAAGSGTSPTTAHAELSGLESGTTYHYRLVAISADGTTASADATFSTTGNPAGQGGPLPVVSEAAAVNLTTSSVQLNGAINPEGPTTTWYFQYGLSDYYGLQTTPQALSGLGARPVNTTVSGLQPGTSYHYRLVAVSANGLYVGPDQTFVTRQAARARPSALVMRAYVHHRRGAVSLVIAGYVGLPASIPSSRGCFGAVAIEIRRGNNTIQLHRAFLHPNCTYRMSAVIYASRLAHASRLGVFGRFEGNATLLPLTRQESVLV